MDLLCLASTCSLAWRTITPAIQCRLEREYRWIGDRLIGLDASVKAVDELTSGLLSEDEERAWNARLDPNDEDEQGDEDSNGDVDEDENEEDDDWPPSMLSGKFWSLVPDLSSDIGGMHMFASVYRACSVRTGTMYHCVV
jgi:hypothetical protein